jgi:hypothetical protein
MRWSLCLLMLAACSAEPQPPAAGERATYAGQGRDRLCIRDGRAGFITYGGGDTNCSVRGRLERPGGDRLVIVPDGDEDCRIDASSQAGHILLGSRGAGCAYYCGPGADFAGKAFTRQDSASPVVDFAGDPLC